MEVRLSYRLKRRSLLQKSVVAMPGEMAMLARMKTSLEERVSELEKWVETLSRRVGEPPLEIKDWRKAIGMLEDTPFVREAFDLGAAQRREQTEP